ncbi:MAG: ABC transporter permease [Chloroflexi bacterium]|nr:ABC transporter permease [Chloroflexota bacterium]
MEGSGSAHVPVELWDTQRAVVDTPVVDDIASSRPERSRWLSRRWVVVGIGAILPLTLLVLWQLTTTLGIFTPYQLRSPGEVWTAAVQLFERGLLVKYVVISTQRVLIGFAIGASLGLLLGAITGLARVWDIFFGSTLGAIRAVPSLAWVPLFVLWLKIGEESKITLLALGAFFPVYTTVSAALRHVDRHLVEAGQAFGLRGLSLFLAVQLPSVLPAVISGLRLALAQAWLFLVAAELLAASAGLGFLLIDSQNNGRVDNLLLAIVLLGIVGKTTDSILGVFERRAIRRWT